MPTLDWSRAGKTATAGKTLTAVSAILAVVFLLLWAGGGVRWQLYGGLLWAAAAAAGFATAAGWLPESGKGRRR
jgi:hypothetical protein